LAISAARYDGLACITGRYDGADVGELCPPDQNLRWISLEFGLYSLLREFSTIDCRPYIQLFSYIRPKHMLGITLIDLSHEDHEILTDLEYTPP
jgi:hypothetical protein